MYEHAHHDLWWARAQQWNVANWTLLLMAGNVGVVRALVTSADLAFNKTWLFWLLNLVIPILASCYLSRLHRDIVHNRLVYRELEAQTGIRALREQLQIKGLERADERTDRTRGVGILWVMGTVFALAGAFATLFLGGVTGDAIIIGLFLFAVDTGVILGAA